MNVFADALKKEDPDLVISDFYSVFAHRAADKIGKPLIIHAPSPMELLIMIQNQVRPAPKCTTACCGCLCISKNMMLAGLDGFYCIGPCIYPDLKLDKRSLVDKF